MKKIILIGMCFYLFAFQAQSNAKRALFIGNSYTFYNDMPALVRSCGLSVGDTLVTDQNTISGYTWNQHASDATTVAKIKQGGFDHVVLQANSLEFTYSDNTVNTNTLPYGRYLDSLAHVFNPCAQTIFYNTWGRKNGSNGQTYLEQDTLIEKRYKAFANQRSAMVSPVGPVRRYLRSNFPALELYVADESHPTAAGSYVSAVCFYTVIFRKDPTLITYNFSLSAADANAIKQAAKVVLYNNFSKWNVGTFDPAMPVADFSVSSINESTIALTNASLNANSYSWNFGDNNVSGQSTSAHTYAANGTYTITLTAFYCRLRNSLTRQVTVSTVKPIIANVTQFPENVLPSDQVGISANITDNTGILNAVLYWGTSSGNLTNTLPMNFSGGVYHADIPTQLGGQTVYYKLAATDLDNNFMETSEYSYRVREVIITITPSNSTINRSAQQQFAVSATDLNGNPVAFTPTWSTTGGIITSSGLWYGPAAPGVYTITASQSGVNGLGLATVTVSPALVIQGKVEAESYSSMSGIQSESVTDAGGGQDIGFIDANDWMLYEVNVLQSGIYQVEFRLATTVANAKLELFTGTTSLGVLTVPTATGGWQNWQTFTMNVSLTAGTQTLKVLAKTGGYNFNWMNFVLDNTTLGIQDLSDVSATQVLYAGLAPNPFSDNTILCFQSDSEKQIRVYTMQGNLKDQILTTGKTVELGSGLTPGMYCIQIQEGHRLYWLKMEKQ